MAENKKSFILYNDLKSVVEKLIAKDREDGTNNSGELFYHILQYVNDEDPDPINFITEMAFEPIRLQLERDLIKYEEVREKNRENANKRWKKTEKDMRSHAVASDGTIRNANDADNGNDSDIDIVIGTENDTENGKRENTNALEQNSNFIRYNTWIKTEAPYCSNPDNMKQLSEDQFLSLIQKFNTIQIAETILKIENRKDLRERYADLFQTIISWMERELNPIKNNRLVEKHPMVDHNKGKVYEEF